MINYKSGSLSSTVKKYLNKYKSRNPIVVFNLGVNGNSNPKNNANRIVKTYNTWIKAYPNTEFYVMGIG